jgi:phosphoribosylformylglycinamidine synthase
MVGKLPDPAAAPGIGFAEAGDAIALVGPFRPSLAGSELEKLRGELSDGLPEIDLELHAEALAVLRGAIRDGGIRSAHDVSEGGLAVALAESCIEGGIGARVDLSELGADALFGEGPGGVIVSGPRAMVERMSGARVIGEVGGEVVSLTETAGTLQIRLAEARELWLGALGDRFS